MPYRSLALLPDVPWTVLPMAAGWDQFDNSGVYMPYYRKINGIVFVVGLLRTTIANNSGGYIPIATLPEGCRPFGLHSPGLWGSAGYSLIIYNPNGQIQFQGPIAQNFAQWINYSFAIA